jgi:AcrR family transcriptional regulator
VGSVDEDRRQQLAEAICDWMLDHGVGSLSLRPLARALGTSTYTLVYWFGSRDAVVAAGLDESERRQQRMVEAWGSEQGLGDVFRHYWAWCVSDAGRPYVRMFVELGGLAQRSEELRNRVDQAIAPWRDMLEGAGAQDPTFTLATIAGLLLDLVLGGDVGRTSGAAEKMAFELEALTDQRRAGAQRHR